MGKDYSSFGLQDKIAIVTGPSQGIGRAIAVAFAQAGAHLVLAEHPAFHQEALKELGRELKDSTRAAEKKATQIEEQMAKGQRELRQNVLEEGKRLGEEMEQKHKEVTNALERESQELRGAMTDRLALADLLTEVALRLKNEFAIPEKE